jgi:hypothetical protein
MRIQIVLGQQDNSHAEALIDGDHYVTCCTGNPYFAAADFLTQLTIVKNNITGMRTAINMPNSDTKTGMVNSARDTMDRSILKMANKVSDIANDPAVLDINRIIIVNSAGMNAKDYPPHARHIFTVKQGLAGVAMLTAQGGSDANEWQYTSDIINYTGRIAVDTTTVAHTQIPNLKGPYVFFHKAIIAGTKTDWEPPFLFTVL